MSQSQEQCFLKSDDAMILGIISRVTALNLPE